MQRQVIERMGPAGRFSLMAELSDEVIDLSLTAIARLHPELTSREVLARFVEKQHGAEIAAGFRKRQTQR